MKPYLILLDLEETLIESFDDALILFHNIEKIQKLPIFHTSVLGLMSWAIWDWTDKEQEVFNDVRAFIETNDTKFDNRFLWSMQEWGHMLMKHTGTSVSREEIHHIFTKEDMIFKLRKFWQDTEFDHIFLIDDAVDDHLSISLNDGTMIYFLDVNAL